MTTKPSYTYKMVAYPGLESDIVTSKSKKKATSSKLPRELRKVKFYQNVDVYEHIHHSDIPTKVKMEYWFQSDEYEQRQSECSDTITKMEKGGGRNKLRTLGQDDEYCIRGLEHRTKAGRRLVDKSRQEAFNVVRYEQNCQWSDITRHSLDVEALACVYKSATQSSARFARNQGIKDEEYVKSECYGLSNSSPTTGNYKKASSFFSGPSTTTTSRRNSSLRMFQSSNDTTSSTHRRSVY